MERAGSAAAAGRACVAPNGLAVAGAPNGDAAGAAPKAGAAAPNAGAAPKAGAAALAAPNAGELAPNLSEAVTGVSDGASSDTRGWRGWCHMANVLYHRLLHATGSQLAAAASRARASSWREGVRRRPSG